MHWAVVSPSLFRLRHTLDNPPEDVYSATTRLARYLTIPPLHIWLKIETSTPISCEENNSVLLHLSRPYMRPMYGPIDIHDEPPPLVPEEEAWEP